MNRQVAIAGLGTLAAAAGACGQTFQWIPTPAGVSGLLVHGISADGSSVVGSAWGLSNGRRQGFRWREGEGFLWLPMSSNYSGTDAEAISADGSVIVGEFDEITIHWAFRWTAATGVLPLPALPGVTAQQVVTGISGDGQTVIGFHSGIPYNAWRWTASGGTEPFGGDWAVQGISANGEMAVGSAQAGMHVWTAAAGHVTVPTPAGWIGVGAQDASADGTVAVGVLTTAGLGHNAFRWTAAEGFRVLPQAQAESFAWAAAERGKLIVGWIGPGTNVAACAWTDNGRAVDLKQYFVESGIPLGSAVLTQALGVSADGRTIAGTGSGGMWVARVPATLACYANCDGSAAAPALNVNDFVCFLNRYAAGDTWANCDGSTAPPVLGVMDFVCFWNRFMAGCL